MYKYEGERKRELAKAENVCGYAKQTTIKLSHNQSQKKKKQKQKTKKKKNKKQKQKQKQIYLQDPQTNNIKTNLTIIGSEKPKKIEE